MKKIVITACNDLYFNACLTLVASIHKTSFNVVNTIYIYNLGLSNNNIKKLNNLKKVEVKFFEDLKQKYPKIDINNYYKYPKQFAYRGILRHSASNIKGDLIFWIDCGAIFLKSAKIIFDLIEKNDIFIVRDINQKNYTWTHPECIKIMKPSIEELSDYQICSGIFGYKKDGKYQKLINEALEYHYNKECVYGLHCYNYGPNIITGTPIQGHRHDQSIYSILVSRYKCPVQDLFIYGEYRGLKYCNKDTCIYVHRRKYNNHSGLLYKE